jgi:hypothetical protein
MSFIRPTIEELNESLAAGGYGPSFRDQPKPGAKKKARKAQPEETLAIDIAKTLRYAIAPPLTCNADGVMWVAIEQASGRAARQKNKDGKSYDVRGQRNKAKGCRSGIPDMKFWWPGNRGWIELKASKNDTSENQDNAHRELAQAGDKVAVCWTHDEVMDTLRRWGVPLRMRP